MLGFTQIRAALSVALLVTALASTAQAAACTLRLRKHPGYPFICLQRGTAIYAAPYRTFNASSASECYLQCSVDYSCASAAWNTTSSQCTTSQSSVKDQGFNPDSSSDTIYSAQECHIRGGSCPVINPSFEDVYAVGTPAGLGPTVHNGVASIPWSAQNGVLVKNGEAGVTKPTPYGDYFLRLTTVKNSAAILTQRFIGTVNHTYELSMALSFQSYKGNTTYGTSGHQEVHYAISPELNVEQPEVMLYPARGDANGTWFQYSTQYQMYYVEQLVFELFITAPTEDVGKHAGTAVFGVDNIQIKDLGKFQ